MTAIPLILQPARFITEVFTALHKCFRQWQFFIFVPSLMPVSWNKIRVNSLMRQRQKKGFVFLAGAKPIQGIIRQLVSDVAFLGHSLAVDV